ncbi:pyrimidine 5'-nucleotidase [Paracoccaceae bacterium GXU_MW_L88]
MRKEFAPIRHWVFDLDQTLYPIEARLFDQIETRMSDYMVRHLGIAATEAMDLRTRYWRDHGATLAGLVMHHGVDPDHFLRDVHEIDLAGLAPAPRLAAAIAALPGQKIVMTNGGRYHAGRVLAARGLSETFDAVYALEDAAYRPKPDSAAYDAIFGAAGIDTSAGAMFEDDPKNLVEPDRRGMKTVLVGPAAHPPFLTAHTDDLTGFLEALL